MNTEKPTILTVPGLGSSGPLHWQSRWEQLHHCQRVEQAEWDQPVCANWVRQLHHAICQSPGPVLLAAHSLACPTVAHWAATHDASRVAGALLVAPADAERPDFPAGATGFAPLALQRLPFPSIVVASTNDEYVTLARARFFADAWGSRLVNAGARGHLNSDSHLHDWPEGWALLQQLKP
ncbi:alpha/beta hydrolase [Hymenobacter sedentarius]|uniref:Alpha/beta hydrolase n=1 Tax=Hymenobacter sedentarius TaxID=1411621 RepID=A0A0U3JSQ5_9BACT|nr:alpha/beta hydrolase [Hymenobacter sedentarius]ALW83695.1 alpha/beta hydrolase [Hymenobacter sedentarius]